MKYCGCANWCCYRGGGNKREFYKSQSSASRLQNYLKKILAGEPILKYNVTVGFANTDIEAGTMVHSYNTEFREFDRDYAHASEYKPTSLLPEAERATFQGYVRPNGKVRTRNFIGILSTVNCSATVVNKIADWFTSRKTQRIS